MPRIELPFSADGGPGERGKDKRGRRFQQMLTGELKELTQQHRFLLDYLSTVPYHEVGIPEYHRKLSRKLGDLKHPNLVYPVTENVFVHIYPSFEGDRHCYIPIEPVLDLDLSSLMQQVERRLLDYVDRFSATEDNDERRKALIGALQEICGAGESSPRRKSGFFGARPNGKVAVTPSELAGLRYLIVRDKVGLGILEPMIRDSNIEDISCSGLGCVFIEHKIFSSLKSAAVFSTHEELDDFVLALSERVKRPVSLHNPIADAALPDGSRINIVYGRHLSKRGSNFSIRKFAEVPFSILELVELGSLDYRMAAYLSLAIGHGMNLFCSGETASGKTTLLNALTTFIDANDKIVSIEETPELQVPHTNWIREIVEAKKQDSDAGVTMFDLLKAALRQRPDFILVGEIRGAEGSIAFQAMQTGHSVMSTFHAASVEKLIQRITGDPINVPRNYVDNLNIIVIQSSVRLPSGKPARRIISISEMVGYDPHSKSFSFVEVFRWNPVDDTFVFSGEMSSYLLEEKIAKMRGYPPHQKKRIYAELDRRAKIMEKMHKQRGVKGFYEFLQVLAKAQKEGLF